MAEDPPPPCGLWRGKQRTDDRGQMTDVRGKKLRRSEGGKIKRQEAEKMRR